jgi:pimeloyl-ACP methyl ester carboxylesterase
VAREVPVTGTQVVLVHGTFHGGWCFERVVAGLADRGVPAVAVDLLAQSDRSGLRSDLHTDAAHVAEILDGLAGATVLLGHSYGGAVITEAGTHPSVGHLVYLCALVPDRGETCGELFGADAVPEDLVATVDRETAVAKYYHDCDEATVAWGLDQLRPHPLAWMAQRPTDAAWRSKPSTYVVCTEDRTFAPELQRIWAKRCTSSVEWESSHAPFFSHPDWIVDMVADLVQTVPQR